MIMLAGEKWQLSLAIIGSSCQEMNKCFLNVTFLLPIAHSDWIAPIGPQMKPAIEDFHSGKV